MRVERAMRFLTIVAKKQSIEMKLIGFGNAL